ncbi:hypothetical protein SDC9_04220 [bioreactor metagenome]|uniref:Uncharacterized protein n=1 Tax=bioreactor metagenome TaxID=1076179 RepID=A0A644SVF4_9ZZZZ|nr:hypothetical protein [Negativicutes bacterium]
MRQTTTVIVPSLTEVILSDVNAIIPNFSSLVSSYRLLVGSAEEIKRIPGVPEEMFERAVLRFDHCGTLIDILLELLCCKIAFSSDFLSITCAPLDIFQLITTDRCPETNTPAGAAELIILLELVRRLLENGCDLSCFGPAPPIGDESPSPPPAAPPPTQSKAVSNQTNCPEQSVIQCPPLKTDCISPELLDLIVKEALAALQPQDPQKQVSKKGSGI